jgi:hypothetical protein
MTKRYRRGKRRKSARRLRLPGEEVNELLRTLAIPVCSPLQQIRLAICCGQERSNDVDGLRPRLRRFRKSHQLIPVSPNRFFGLASGGNAPSGAGLLAYQQIEQ